MLEPWNDTNLRPPPVLTSLCFENVDIQGLRYAFSTISNVLSKQSPLHKESAIFSRFLYKYDKKFRNDIGFRNFKKVNTALKRYLKLNLMQDIVNFTSILPENDEDNHLPSRQMLEYVMVRLISFSKIMLRVCVCSKHAAVFYLDRVKRGESHWMSLMPYAILSRIWIMCKVLLHHSCTWYSTLYVYLKKLNKRGLDFLPDVYKLPEDLEIWLNLNNMDSIGRFEWSQRKCNVNIDSIFVEDDEGDRFESVFEYLKQINEEDQDETDKPTDTSSADNITECDTMSDSTYKKIDFGEAVSRHNYSRLKEIPVPVPRTTHTAERVTNKDSLYKFINTEEKLRIENSKLSLTNHLSFMQWQTLKNALLNLHESLAKDRKIERKFQKIWQEKCLDYKVYEDE